MQNFWLIVLVVLAYKVLNGMARGFSLAGLKHLKSKGNSEQGLGCMAIVAGLTTDLAAVLLLVYGVMRLA